MFTVEFHSPLQCIITPLLPPTMDTDKQTILKNLCYTDLVYGRINKKLCTEYSRNEIEVLMYDTIKETKINNYEKIGKNYYISNLDKNIRITINSYTYRIITVDKIH